MDAGNAIFGQNDSACVTMNYIWAGLLIFSLLFALVSDIQDIRTDRYRNEKPLTVTLHFPEGYSPEIRRIPVEIIIAPDDFRAFFGVDAVLPPFYSGFLIQRTEGKELRFARDVALPEPLATIREFTAGEEQELRARILSLTFLSSDEARATITFPPVRFVKLNAIAEAAIDFAKTAVSIALGLIGVLALWLGLMRIAEKAGMIRMVVRWIQPILRPLFPEIPRGHPAMAMIILNMAANVLGLGNAATPMGIKAMEEMQKLNPRKDTATDPMVTFLALNTSSVQLLPPATLVAVLGLQINQLFFAIIIATTVSTVVGVLAARLLARLPMYRKTNPQLVEEQTSSEEE